MMNASVLRLEETRCALRDALTRRDWSAIADLDHQCREAVELAMVEPQDEGVLHQRLQDLLDLYRQLVELCQQEQRRLAAELTQLNQGKQGAKVYQLFT